LCYFVRLWYNTHWRRKGNDRYSASVVWRFSQFLRLHTTCRCGAGSGLLPLKLSQHNPAIHLKEQQQANLHSTHLQAPSKRHVTVMRLMMQLSSSSSADTQQAQLQVRGVVDNLVDRKHMQSKRNRRNSGHNMLYQSCKPGCVVSHCLWR